MLGNDYLRLAYVLGLGLLWGYAIVLWIARGRAARRGRNTP